MPPFGAAPYAGRAYDPRAPRISDLLVRQGDVQAEGMRRGGDLWAQAILGLGEAANTGIKLYAQQRADAPRREMEQLQLRSARGELDAQESARQQAADKARRDAELSGLLFGEEPAKPRDIMRLSDGPEQGLAIIKGIAALRDENKAHFTDNQERVRDVALGVLAVPEMARPRAYQVARQRLIQSGVLTEDQISPEYDEALVIQAANYGKEPEKPGTLIQHNPANTLRNPTTGEVVVEGTPDAPEPERTYQVVVRGPNGRPVRKLVTEAELKSGVEEYRAPANGGSGQATPPAPATGSQPIPPELSVAMNRALSGRLTRDQRAQMRSTIETLASSGDVEGAREEIKKAVLTGVGQGERDTVNARADMIAAMTNIKATLAALRDSGVETGLLSGTVENVAQKLGKTSNPALARLGAELTNNLLLYRRSVTGAAFGVTEATEYAKLLPSYSNESTLNEAVIDGFVSSLRRFDDAFWKRSLGTSLGAIQTPAPARKKADASRDRVRGITPTQAAPASDFEIISVR